MWEEFIRRGNKFKYTKEQDPYWDPETYQSVAYAFVTLECLMFSIAFEGEVAIIKSGRKIGRLMVSIYPSDSKGTSNSSIEGRG